MARARKQDVTRAVTRPARGVRRLVKRIASQPGVSMLQPGPLEGKRGVRRLIKRDPSDGLTMPEANKITETHTDLGGAADGGVRVVRQGSDYNKPTGAGVRVIPPPTSGRLRRR
jgi:hypothetical protein